MTSDTLLTVVGVSLGSPAVLAVITSVLTNRARRADAIIRLQEKQQDWKRQDEVASQAATAARLLISANAQVATMAEVTANKTFGKLDQIHTLVNSNMTAAMNSELEALEGKLIVMNELISLKKKLGDRPTEQALGAISTAESKISELRATIKDRLEQTKLANNQLKKSG